MRRLQFQHHDDDGDHAAGRGEAHNLIVFAVQHRVAASLLLRSSVKAIF
jgi:hypothetical protein